MPTEKKLHILIMDDTLEALMRAARINPSHMLDGAGVNADIQFAKKADTAYAILAEWAEQGIQPDIVSTDVLYDHTVAIADLDGIMQELYADTPELKPAKIYVHSKSGIDDGDKQYEIARRYMEKLGAEYVHTGEWLTLGDQFSEGFYADSDRWAPTTNVLRQHLKDTFGIETNTLTREDIEANKNRAAAASVGDNIAPYAAIHAVDDGGITPDVALLKISPALTKQALEPQLNNYNEDGNTIDYHPVEFHKGMGGAATGVAAFTADEVKQYKAEGKQVILVLNNFTPADVPLLANVDGVVLLGRGSSHLPVLCENHGIAGVFSQSGMVYTNREAKPLSIQQGDAGYQLVCTNPQETDEKRKALYEFTVRSGEPISIETVYITRGLSTTPEAIGKLYRQGIPLKEERYDLWWVDKPMQWARAQSTQEWHRRGNRQCHGLTIKANADSAAQVKAAFATGAQGIGLLRTEHMMMQGDQLHQLQTYMLAEDDAIKRTALAQLKASQTQEFTAIYTEVKNAENANYAHKTSPLGLTNMLPLPVTIRLFDAKPDEILPLPENETDVARLAADTHLSEQAIKAKLAELRAKNERGVQFGLQHRELYQAQIDALFEAAKIMDAADSGHHTIVPEIMVPMVTTPEELATVKEWVAHAAQQHGFTHQPDAPAYRFGTMIETTGAVKNAAALAAQSDFFSVGSNDLTQEITGLKRDDIVEVEAWMNNHHTQNPFRTLHQDVKEQIQTAVKDGLTANPSLKVTVCGQQVAGDSASIAFCQSLDMNAISVPANLASQMTSSIIAGQEALKAHQAAQAENKAWRAAGGKILGDAPTPTMHPTAATGQSQQHQADLP